MVTEETLQPICTQEMYRALGWEGQAPECSAATALLGLRDAGVPRTGVTVASPVRLRGGRSLLVEPGAVGAPSETSTTKCDCLATAGLPSPGISVAVLVEYYAVSPDGFTSANCKYLWPQVNALSYSRLPWRLVILEEVSGASCYVPFVVSWPEMSVLNTCLPAILIYSTCYPSLISLPD